ncbi:MAG: hypothetical protein P0120_15630 [Nitrospira sp.]|nr:hypothetical protein [Nitrospira sp.]MDF0675747.1 hypothetical protein [Nitrospira sp.]
MVYVGLDVSGKSLVGYAVNERKQRVWMGEQPATRGLWALVRLPVSAPLRLILETFMTSIATLVTAEQQLT